MTNTFHTDLVAALAALSNPAKDAKADTGKFAYTYATLPAILDLVRPVLAAHNLAVVQDVAMDEGRTLITTRVLHSSGEQMTFGPIVGKGGSSWQELGSAITYARRYSLTAALGIAGDEDDDAQAVSHVQATPKIERISHSDQAIQDDPWASNAPVAVAEQFLGAEPLYTKEERPRNHPEPASPAQVKFAKALATEWATEKGQEDALKFLNGWLMTHNYGSVNDWDSLGWRAAKPFIESAKTRGNHDEF